MSIVYEYEYGDSREIFPGKSFQVLRTEHYALPWECCNFALNILRFNCHTYRLSNLLPTDRLLTREVSGGKDRALGLG